MDGRRFEYGREVPVAVISESGWRPAKWLRKRFRQKYPLLSGKRDLAQTDFGRELLPLVAAEMGGQLWEMVYRERLVVARFRFDGFSAQGYLDEFGNWLADPKTKRDYPEVCERASFARSVKRSSLT